MRPATSSPIAPRPGLRIAIEGLSRGIESLAVSAPVRILVAVLILAFHLFAITTVAKDRFGHDFNSTPDAAPRFADPHTDAAAENWNRLVVSRWDSAHYIGLALRLYSPCKARGEIASGNFADMDVACDVKFYPGYAMLGRAIARVTKLPIDYALFGISILASGAFLFMWTSREIVGPLGVRNAYVSLLIMAAFSSAYSFVVIGTEPCALAFTLAAYLAMRRRDLLLGALFAGAATGMRVSALAVGFAYAAALFVQTLEERAPLRVWLARISLMPVAGWGFLAIAGYHWYRFGDPLLYFHSHERAYWHKPNLSAIFFPEGTMLAKAIVSAPNDAVLVALALITFALGHRPALHNFCPSAKAFWYVLFAGVVGISMVGSVELAYAGMTRYLILALPLFFVMASLLSRHTVGLGLWVLFSLAHFWNVELCGYLSRDEPNWQEKCNFSMYQ